MSPTTKKTPFVLFSGIAGERGGQNSKKGIRKGIYESKDMHIQQKDYGRIPNNNSAPSLTGGSNEDRLSLNEFELGTPPTDHRQHEAQIENANIHGETAVVNTEKLRSMGRGEQKKPKA